MPEAKYYERLKGVTLRTPKSSSALLVTWWERKKTREGQTFLARTENFVPGDLKVGGGVSKTFKVAGRPERNIDLEGNGIPTKKKGAAFERQRRNISRTRCSTRIPNINSLPLVTPSDKEE